MDDLLVFRRFQLDELDGYTERCMAAAKDKLHTLFPAKHLVALDAVTLGIETDSLYSDTGIDTYELGLVDDELPAMRNTRDGSVITFRV
ncbi:MAG: hypothetical protein MJZ40_02065 [Bacteroidaceae bacterium]|nr:hypothetical protein [Bacteroidaceae bacterium]